ncbi:sigma-70 family RNA polymerase sigma factor [Amycolatopsis sp. cg9]|uniref:sigma-70 family RNA polymerase sigma factor n=1 Tax=Amycolatopsis sp. cg9 TaxID=3238801 RepID=UPI003525B9F7
MPTTMLTSEQPATVPFQRTSAHRTPCSQRQDGSPARHQVPPAGDEPDDAALIAAVRDGQHAAYGVLFRRHRPAAYNLANQLTNRAIDPDDLVAEAFAKVFAIMRAGGGPHATFRAYLLTSLRHVAYDRTRRARKVEFTEDVETFAIDTNNPELIAEPFQDTAVAQLERGLVARAFARLSERWQEVLWRLEVEEMTPVEIAPVMGLTPNGVSALAYRAREALRQAYLQEYVAEPDGQPEACRVITGKLGAWQRGGLSKRETAQVDAHLETCPACRAVAAELWQELPA